MHHQLTERKHYCPPKTNQLSMKSLITSSYKFLTITPIAWEYTEKEPRAFVYAKLFLILHRSVEITQHHHSNLNHLHQITDLLLYHGTHCFQPDIRYHRKH